MGLLDFFRRKKTPTSTGSTASALRCPKCNAGLDRARDRYGKAEHEEPMAFLGISHVRLRCPKCKTVMDVTG